MPAPVKPLDEPERLAALRALNVVHSPDEERFDRITRLARKLFDTPIAVVSFVDETTQWFKSRQGLEVDRTPREISFCGHAILEDGPLVVTDASRDERFADNPLVTGEMAIRFYAGQPVKSADGRNVGTLCVIDTQPRALDLPALDALKDLAALVESELRLGRLSEAQQELIATLDTTRREAMMDPLTAAWNRRGILDVLRRELARGDRERRPVGIILLDVDHFKRVNDRHGHATGDRALRHLVGTIRRCVREYDAVGRYGGEEFLVVAGDCDLDRAAAVAEKIRRRIASGPLRIPGGEIALSASFGVVASVPWHGGEPEAWIEAADRALYRAKAAGRDRVERAGADDLPVPIDAQGMTNET